MPNNFPTSPTNDPKTFGERVYSTALRLAQARFERGSDAGAHDMAMLVFLQFWSNPSQYISSYSPEVFAAVSLRNRAEDWRRTERIQRGQGAHLVEFEGAKVARRDIGSLDDLTDRIGDITRDDHDVATAATVNVDVHHALALLSQLQRTLLWRVAAEGYSVVEVAKTLGLSRSYCQRQLGEARNAVRDYVVAA
ncbi:MAG: sigma-70 family RNA polymerase sigma factor [Acidimicrobiales bacterium]